jgi:hypothetical protein
MFAAAAIDGLFISYRQFPFACSYLPVENPKLLWPVGVSSLLFVTYGFASVERMALQTATRTADLGAALVAIVVLVKAIDRARRRERRPLNFDERPAPATQRLGLFDRVAMHDPVMGGERIRRRMRGAEHRIFDGRARERRAELGSGI